MIRRIVDTIKADIQALTWVERFGGIVTPITFQLEGETDEQTVVKTLPISNYLNDADCIEEKDRYHFLVPDDSKKSVVYIEQIGNSVFTPSTRRGSRYRDVVEGVQQLRLVCWVNLTAIGAQDQFVTADLMYDIWAEIDGKKVPKLDDNEPKVPLFSIEWKVVADVLKDMTIFNPYFYENEPRLMLYPHDFFALDLEVTWYMKKSCRSAFNVADPVQCIDVNQEGVVMSSFDGVPFGTLDGDDMSNL